ncbi:beta strand repeat-containing protein, partial [Xanthobacteraceae bacterium A53D]
MGGLVGRLVDSSITNAYYTGAVSGSASVGGLVGGAYESIIVDSYASGTVNSTYQINVGGLVGVLSESTVSNSYSTSTVSGPGNVGGLIGHAQAGNVITNVYATGAVTGSSTNVGGLVGLSEDSSITNAYATGTVTGPLTGGESIKGTGGLVGFSINGAIANVYATGSVSGDEEVGGLLGGTSGGTLTNAYATGDVTGYLRVGGLVGSSKDGTLSHSYATGGVTGSGLVGGLVGLSERMTISNVYATGAATSYNLAGGLVGSSAGDVISNAYATGAVSSGPLAGGLIGGATSTTLTNTYASGAVSGSTNVGGLVGFSLGANVTNSFWNVETTGRGSSAAGGTGLTTAQMQSLATFTGAGWDIDAAGGTGAVWRIYEGQTSPLLRSFMTTLTVTANDLTKTYDGNAFTGNGVTYAGFVNGDTPSSLNGTLVYGGTAQDAKNAGTYVITPTGQYSGQQGYDIAYVSGALTVNKAVLNAGLTGVTKTYDGTIAAALASANFTLSGVVGGDAVSIVATSGTYDTANAGTGKTVQVSGLTLTGAAAGNYELASTSLSQNVGVITRAALTITADNASKTYDGQAYNGGNGLTYSGFVDGEDQSVLGGTLTYSGASQGAVNVGTYAITASGLTSGNYAITYADGELRVNRAALTITANHAGKTYDGLAYSGGNGVTYSGFVNGETSSVLDGTIAYGGTAQGAVNADTYAITASGLTSDNYAITYADGELRVNRAALTITANHAGKTYDGLA